MAELLGSLAPIGALLSFVAMTVTAAIVFLFATFATHKMVQDTEAGLRQYVDQKHEGVLRIMDYQNKALERIDQRTYREMGGPPPERAPEVPVEPGKPLPK